MKKNNTKRLICSVWILTKTMGIPPETAAENQAIVLTIVGSIRPSLGRGMKRMELITVERESGR